MKVPIRYLISKARVLREEFGISLNQLLSDTGIAAAELEDPTGHITRAQELAVYRNTRRLAPAPGTAFRLGQALRPGDYGLLGHTLISSETVGSALTLLNEFVAIDAPLLSTHYLIEGNSVVISLQETTPLGEVHQFAVEEMLAVWRYCELPVPGLEKYVSLVEVPYAKPSHSHLYRALFSCPIKFDRTRAAVHLPLAVLDLPIRFSDPDVARILQHRCQAILSQIDHQSGLVAQVRETLIGMPIGAWSPERIAEAQNLSVLQLRKLLDQQATSYGAIKDDVRKALALDYLSDVALSIDRIARLMGYANSSNFVRAFKRWRGIAPAAYRRQLG